MNKAFRVTLIVIGLLTITSGLVFAGAWVERHTAYRFPSPVSAYPNGDDRRPGSANGSTTTDGGYGMMNGSRRTAPGMMNGNRSAAPGMMNGYGTNNTPVTPLTVDQAYQAAENYLNSLNNSDLKIAEVMVFDNNAYVRVVEQSTGIGAFELLVDPATLAVTPEHGPNMMWNLKYSGLNHESMMGATNGMMSGGNGMMGNRGGTNGNNSANTVPSGISATMPVSSTQALQAAQQYLNTALPGAKTAADADPFYGYYTIDILRDGNIIGMLSVNGFSSQVFMHTWHGTFIATQDY